VVVAERIDAGQLALALRVIQVQVLGLLAMMYWALENSVC
jgi:hypothetical protein